MTLSVLSRGMKLILKFHRSLIHTFAPTDLISTPSTITAISQSPAIDVLGVGYASGQCVLFDVRLGEVLGKVRLEGEGSGEITGVAFRNGTLTDISARAMVSSYTLNTNR